MLLLLVPMETRSRVGDGDGCSLPTFSWCSLLGQLPAPHMCCSQPRGTKHGHKPQLSQIHTVCKPFKGQDELGQALPKANLERAAQAKALL